MAMLRREREEGWLGLEVAAGELESSQTMGSLCGFFLIVGLIASPWEYILHGGLLAATCPYIQGKGTWCLQYALCSSVLPSNPHRA